tara:strand:+ start:15096 stop:15716 length:621 start_codon:yes stop_codon:yes gene_type:complete
MEIDSELFPTHMKEYLQILACKYIDDDTVFMKHLTKQAQLKNEAAQHQLDVMQMFSDLKTQVQTYIHDMQMLGYQRITDVCSFIQAQDQVPTISNKQWTVCALSGVNTNSFLELHHNSRRLCLDQKYAAFAACLWLLQHIDIMEFNRMRQYLDLTAKESNIKDILDLYVQTELTAEVVKMYCNAFAIVFKVLQHTKDEILASTTHT